MFFATSPYLLAKQKMSRFWLAGRTTWPGRVGISVRPSHAVLMEICILETAELIKEP